MSSSSSVPAILYYPDQHVDPAPSEPVTVSSLQGISLIDTSGSTVEHSILTDELAMSRQFNYRYNVSWNDQAFLYGQDEVDFYSSVRSDGQTEPVVIFSSVPITNQLLRSQIIVFSTDGEVKSDEIAKFSAQVNSFMGHATLIVCVVAGSTDDVLPMNVNISVFASLLTFKHVLLIHLEKNRYRLLCASLSMTAILKNQLNLDVPPAELGGWDSLPELTPEQILTLKVPLNTRHPIPMGYRVLPNEVAIHLEQLLSEGGKAYAPQVYACLEQCFPAILLHCKNDRLLSRLKTWILEQGTWLTHKDKWLEQVEQALVIDHATFYSSASVSSYMSSQ
jgi:hypothetical protein